MILQPHVPYWQMRLDRFSALALEFSRVQRKFRPFYAAAAVAADDRPALAYGGRAISWSGNSRRAAARTHSSVALGASERVPAAVARAAREDRRCDGRAVKARLPATFRAAPCPASRGRAEFRSSSRRETAKIFSLAAAGSGWFRSGRSAGRSLSWTTAPTMERLIFCAARIRTWCWTSIQDPLSFARAVNAGIRKSRFSHVCLLNNDMADRGRFLCGPAGRFR